MDLAKIVIEAVDKTQSGFASAKSGMRDVEGQVGSLKSAVLGLTGLLGAGLFANLVREMLAFNAGLDDLAQITGSSVENLSAIRRVTDETGQSFETVTGALVKLTKGLAGSDEETKGARGALKALGIEAEDANGQLKESAELYFEVAKALDRYKDGSEKTAIVMDLFGKAGAQNLPILKDLAKQGELNASVTAEQAAAAADFEDRMTRMRVAVSEAFRVVAQDWLPALESLLNMLTGAGKETGSVAEQARKLSAEGKLREWGESVALGFAFVMDAGQGVMDIFEIIGRSIAATALKWEGYAQTLIGVAAISRGDFLNGQADIQAGLGKTRAAVQSFGEDVQRILGRTTFRDKLREQFRADKEAREWQTVNDAIEEANRSVLTYTSGNSAARLKAEEERKKADEAARRERERLQAEDIKGWVAYIEARTKEYEDGLRAEAAMVDKANEEKKKSDMEYAKWRLAEMEKLREEERRQNQQIADSLTDALMRGFEGGKGFAENFRETLKNMFKTLVLRPIIQPVAQMGANFIQQLMGGMTGGGGGGGNFMSTIMNLFSGGGGGSGGNFLSSIMNMFGGGGTPVNGGSFYNVPGVSSPTGMAGGNFMGNIMASMGSNPLGWMAALSAISGAAGQRLFSGNRAAQTASYFGIGMGAIVNLLTGGSKENQNFRFMQGTGQGEGLFGGLGVEGTYGFDLKALRSQTGTLDTRILRLLGGDQSAGTAALAAYTAAGRRADGQPAQFAFPEGDQTAGEQIAKELFKSRYGTLFTLIDKSFAEEIKNFSGTSAELQAFIESVIGLFEAIGSTKIKGLNIANLRAMQAEGEELGATLSRITEGMALVNSVGVNQTDGFLAAFKLVQDEFAAAGVTGSVSVETYRALREQIDFSTDAGRAMYDMLVRVAPAMQQIEQAAKQMLDGFNANLGSIFGSSFTRQMIEGRATGLVSQFQSMTGLLGGMDPLAVFRGIGGANASDLQYLYSTGGPELQTLLSEIIALYAQYSGLQEQVNTNTQQLGQVTAQVVDRLGESRNGIAEWLRDLLMDDRLSPLNPAGQLDLAQSQYVENLMKAQAGDADALSRYTSFAQAYLEELRAADASGARYQAGAAAVATQAAGLSGLAQVRPVTAADTAANTAEIVKAVNQLRVDLGQANQTNAELLRRLARSTDINGDKQARALNDVASAW